jgi:hypothetical protein
MNIVYISEKAWENKEKPVSVRPIGSLEVGLQPINQYLALNSFWSRKMVWRIFSRTWMDGKKFAEILKDKRVE